MSQSAKPLIQILEKMLVLHKSLHQLAKKKTDILKAGDTDALSNLLNEEKHHIEAIQKLEKERQYLANQFVAEAASGLHQQNDDSKQLLSGSKPNQAFDQYPALGFNSPAFNQHSQQAARQTMQPQNPANATISDCITYANGKEKQKLQQLKNDLEKEINELSNRNKLNQELLIQSLQFVNLSLDLFMPEIDAYNYERPGQTSQPYGEGRSFFNSKV